MKIKIILTESDIKNIITDKEAKREHLVEVPKDLKKQFGNLEISLELSEFDLTNLIGDIVKAEIKKYA